MHSLSQMEKLLGGAWAAEQVWWLFYGQTPWQWARTHLIGGVALISVRGKAVVQSLVHPSLLPVLVARAGSCLGHIQL